MGQAQDWEYAEESWGDESRLVVVLGYAFQSEHYETESLKKNIAAMFERAIKAYDSQVTAVPVRFDFRPLRAGYGEHLFNEIARDIISADIAVFDTSDQNPNVMVEMGVSLT